jgi:hypothetical protein
MTIRSLVINNAKSLFFVTLIFIIFNLVPDPDIDFILSSKKVIISLIYGVFSSFLFVVFAYLVGNVSAEMVNKCGCDRPDKQ